MGLIHGKVHDPAEAMAAVLDELERRPHRAAQLRRGTLHPPTGTGDEKYRVSRGGTQRVPERFAHGGRATCQRAPLGLRANQPSQLSARLAQGVRALLEEAPGEPRGARCTQCAKGRACHAFRRE